MTAASAMSPSQRTIVAMKSSWRGRAITSRGRGYLIRKEKSPTVRWPSRAMTLQKTR